MDVGAGRDYGYPHKALSTCCGGLYVEKEHNPTKKTYFLLIGEKFEFLLKINSMWKNP